MRLTQCEKCPWRKDVDPHDIPNGYCENKHRGLESTIARGVLIGGELIMMACHEAAPGKEQPCVGWMHNQLGAGNNIALRMWHMDQVRKGKIKGSLKLVGEQHDRFEDTLP